MELALLLLAVISLRGDWILQGKQFLLNSSRAAGDASYHSVQLIIERLTENQKTVLGEILEILKVSVSGLSEKELEALMPPIELVGEITDEHALQALKKILDQNPYKSGIQRAIDTMKDRFNNYYKIKRKSSVDAYHLSSLPSLKSEKVGYFDKNSAAITIISIYISQFTRLLDLYAQSEDPGKKDSFDKFKFAFQTFLEELEKYDVVNCPTERDLLTNLKPILTDLIAKIEKQANWDSIDASLSSATETATKVFQGSTGVVVRAFVPAGMECDLGVIQPSDLCQGIIGSYLREKFSLQLPYIQRGQGNKSWYWMWGMLECGMREKVISEKVEARLEGNSLEKIIKAHARLIQQLDNDGLYASTDVDLLADSRNGVLKISDFPEIMRSNFDKKNLKKTQQLVQTFLQSTFLLRVALQEFSSCFHNLGERIYISGEYRQWLEILSFLSNQAISNYEALYCDEYFSTLNRILGNGAETFAGDIAVTSPEHKREKRILRSSLQVPRTNVDNPFKEKLEALHSTVDRQAKTQTRVCTEAHDLVQQLIDFGSWFDRLQKDIEAHIANKKIKVDKTPALRKNNIKFSILLSRFYDFSSESEETTSDFKSIAKAIQMIKEKLDQFCRDHVDSSASKKKSISTWLDEEGQKSVKEFFSYDPKNGVFKLHFDVILDHESLERLFSAVDAINKKVASSEGGDEKLNAVLEYQKKLDTLSSPTTSRHPAPPIRTHGTEVQWFFLVYNLLYQTQAGFFKYHSWKSMPVTVNQIQSHISDTSRYDSRTQTAWNIAKTYLIDQVLDDSREGKEQKAKAFKAIYKASRSASFFSQTRKLNKKCFDEFDVTYEQIETLAKDKTRTAVILNRLKNPRF